jgi:hypothetical protein
MKDASNTWALVVGIESYDFLDVPRLTGPINDAVAAVSWLRALGVPDGNICLNVAPQDDPRITALGLVPRSAEDMSIWRSISEIAGAAGSDRLFVFLSGHGIYDTESRQRLFLTQEYAVGNNYAANLDIAKYIDYFRSLNFRRQFLFFDGCQNNSTASGQRSPIVPTGPKNNIFNPDPRNGLIACFAASQGQRAIEIDHRGAMLRRLLEQLDIAQLKSLPISDARQDTIDYGWNDGSLLLDLKKLFDDIVSPYVVADAAKLGYVQTPGLEPFGAATTGPMPLLGLPSLSSVELTTDVEPLPARSAIQRIHLHVRLPSRDRNLPIIPHPLVLPDQCWVPANCDVELICIPAANWEVRDTPAPFTATRPQHAAVFKLVQRPSSPPPKDLELFNVRFSHGGLGLPGPPYNDLASQVRLSNQTDAGTTETAGLMIDHEYGPDFRIGPQGYDVSRDLTVGWARALRRWAPPNVDVVVAPPGQTIETSYPNLRFDVTEGWARQLAGFLDEAALVTIGQSASSQQASVTTFSAAAIEDLRAVHVEPGRNRIRIDLPWGTWTDFVDVPFQGEASCKPPPNVGLPPLRNQAPRQCSAGTILVNGQPGTVTVGGVPIMPEFTANGWIGFDVHRIVEQSRIDGTTPVMSIEHLAGAPQFDAYAVQFRLPASELAYTLLVDLTGYPPRVEPYSNTGMIEWDLIVSCGRLDAISRERITSLCGDSWPKEESWLLQLGIAYAAYATGSWNDLRSAIQHLRSSGIDVIDVDLLDFECIIQLGPDHKPDRALASRLIQRLGAGALSIFRWGMPLARRASTHNRYLSLIERAMPKASTFVTWIAAARTMDRTPTPTTSRHGTEEKTQTAVAY